MPTDEAPRSTPVAANLERELISDMFRINETLISSMGWNAVSRRPPEGKLLEIVEISSPIIHKATFIDQCFYVPAAVGKIQRKATPIMWREAVS